MHLKTRLRDRKRTLAVWLELASPAAAEVLVHAGFTHLIIDNEHSPASLETTAHMLRAIEAAGGEAILRVPANDPTYLKRVLELGACNILIPMVESASAARLALDACRYPPRGRRGFASEIRAARYGTEADYPNRAHERLCLIVQIESRAGVDNAEAIAAVDGIDCLFVGPYDLSGSYGKLGQTGAAEVVAAIEDVERIAKAKGLPLGTVPRTGADADAQFARGYSLVAAASDVGLLQAGALALSRGNS